MADESMKVRLKKLPLRSIVAFAARCARRGQQVFSESGANYSKAPAERAIAVAESYAMGNLVSAAAADAAADVAHAACAFTASAAARAAARATDAADYATDTARVANLVTVAARFAADSSRVAVAARIAKFAALRDLVELESLAAGNSQSVGESFVGEPIDPSESGPMGPLWPNGLPGIAANRGNRDVPKDSYSGSEYPIENEHPRLTVYVDPGTTDIETVRDLFLALSSLYEGHGGSGLKIVSHEQRTPVRVAVPV